MVILEYPIEFGLLPSWLASSHHPVLENDCTREFARTGLKLNLIPEVEAIARINEGERVYTCSETALELIVTKVDNPELTRAIETCKDKAALRRAVQSTDPDFFFLEATASELRSLDYHSLPTRFILKPNRGFCSVGVFVIECEKDWNEALAAIEDGKVTSSYPQNVIDETTYILEQFIDGTEYALDMYYDDEGKPHILNVLRHDFASPEDTSDRLYITSPSIISSMVPRFSSWFARLNEELRFSNFCIHVETRVDGDTIRAIEFNPLRFAGIGGTDISHYAYDYYTYEAYLDNRDVDFEEIAQKHAGKVFAMSLIVPEPDTPPSSDFDMEAFCAPLPNVLEARRLDTEKTGAWAFIFAEADEANEDRLTHLMNADLHDYVI